MVALMLARRFWPNRSHYAPIDAAALEKYRFFSRLGFFPVRQDSLSGAAEFLRTSLAILKQPAGVLWITPEGKFTDPRNRSNRFLPGLRGLAGRVKEADFVSLAIEYPFWQERFPEVLCRFEPCGQRGPDDWLESTMRANQCTLATQAIARDPAAFETILTGRGGVHPVYDLWRRGKALLQGRSFAANHGDEA